MISKKKLFNVKASILVLFVLVIWFWLCYLYGTGPITTDFEKQVQSFTLVLWSILLEALPFVLLGTIISSLIQVFVTEDTILRVLPKNNMLRLIFASCLGLIFPVCECAIVPITRGLVKKGMPIGPAIAFMLATPIVNPVVLLSTYNAFPSMPIMAVYRGVFGFLGAIIIGYFIDIKAGNSPKVLREDIQALSCGCSHDHHNQSHSHSGHSHHEECSSTGQHHKHNKTLKSIMKEIISHTNHELQSVGAYLIFGAIIATSMQLFVSKDIILSVGGNRTLSILAMMTLAFVLSLCSEADAFIGSTFMIHFSSASVLAFLITGPMIDIKNTMMLFGSFKRKFVVKLITLILIVCFVLAFTASLFLGGNYA